MIIVAGTLQLTEIGLASIRDAARAVILATREEEGCILYSFAADLTEPGLVRIYEEWESRETLKAHGASAHVAAWREALKSIDVKSSELRLIEVTSVEPFA
ncbi:putative quinol monooxygenase [Aureimonas sp. AU12]|jgi:quinol monooxygenase YgiN|uniref:putative quinol monooxygenase n=1 Tax=Aureimonas sp. AU12 TaxID=1638161 RepID=UPI0007066798|nr:putative quinol monooxygenase [Aureimonas sp. AU12]BAT29701.1 antibiotic biosynthesis monooxygenase [Aureimonas sp. AU12]